jgi:integrase
VQAQEFLEHVKNAKSKNTFKEYRNGLQKFSEWYGKDLDTILKERKEDLESDDPVRRRRFERKLEEFHRALMEKGYAVNSCRTLTLGLIQLFNYFDMDMKTRIISTEAKKTVETEKSYPLTIEEVRLMYAVADSLHDKVLLLLGKDLGLRLADVLSIKRDEIPDLDQEAPIPFQRMTGKEKVLSRGFLSDETVAMLKAYLPTLKGTDNPYLFPNKNGKGPITDDTVNNTLNALADKTKIKVPEGQALTFHCFRKLFLTYCIESGVGLTAGKLMCGKAVAKADRTYIHNARLKKLFLQLQKMTRITDVAAYTAGTDRMEQLEKTIETLQKDLISYKTSHELSIKRLKVVMNENVELKGTVKELAAQYERLNKAFQSWDQTQGELEAALARLVEAKKETKSD